MEVKEEITQHSFNLFQEMIRTIVKDELDEFKVADYPLTLNLRQASEFVGVNRNALKNIFYYYRDEVEVSMKNPQGFVNFPDPKIWIIHRDKLKKWIEENQYKIGSFN